MTKSLRKSSTRVLGLFSLALCGLGFASALDAPRTTTSFDKGWRFQTGATPAAAAAQFDDSAWETIALPHNLPIVEKNYNRFPYRGEAWYRKAFTTPPEWKCKRVFLPFDGVNLVSDVYPNGELLGEHRGGFSAFTCGSTPIYPRLCSRRCSLPCTRRRFMRRMCRSTAYGRRASTGSTRAPRLYQGQAGADAPWLFNL